MNPDSIAVIRGRNEDMLKEQRLAQRHLEQMAIAGDIEKSVYTAVETITRFFSLYTGKTEVLNPVTSVATPDIVQVVKSVQDLGEIVKLSRTDLTPILSELSKVLQQLEALPKELPKLEVEKTEEVKVSNLADIKEFDYKRLEKLIKGLDFKQPAPVVNVPQANVQVDAPNLEPIKKSLLDVIKAVKANKVEVPKTDLSKVEKLLEKNNKLQAEILDKPIGGGGGGGVPTENGAVKTVAEQYTIRIAQSGVYTFIAEAAPGTDTAASLWRIQRVDSTGNLLWKDGDSKFDNTATDITAGSFA